MDYKIIVDKARFLVKPNGALASTRRLDQIVSVVGIEAGWAEVVNDWSNDDPPRLFCLAGEIEPVEEEPPVDPPPAETVFTVPVGKNKVEFDQFPGQVFANENRITYRRVA